MNIYMNMNMNQYNIDMYMNRQMNVMPVMNDDIDNVLQQMETEHVRMIMQRQQQVDDFTHELQTSIMQLNQFLYNWQHNLIDVDTKCSFIQYYNSLCKTNEHNMKDHTQPMQAIIKYEARHETRHEARHEIKQEPFNDDNLSSTMDVNKFIGNLLQ